MKLKTAFYLFCLFLQSVKTDVEIHEYSKHRKLVSTYVRDVNRFRRLLDAADMFRISWNQTLADICDNQGRNLIRQFGCSNPWVCDQESGCDHFLNYQLKRHGLFHEILMDYDLPDHGMGRMFKFLGIKSQKCGHRYEDFLANFSECRENALKIFSSTHNVGCSHLVCNDPSDDKPEKHHFICIFASNYSMAVDQDGHFQLYKPATYEIHSCSRCPRGMGKCVDRLCAQTGARIFISQLLLVFTCMLHLVILTVK